MTYPAARARSLERSALRRTEELARRLAGSILRAPAQVKSSRMRRGARDHALAGQPLDRANRRGLRDMLAPGSLCRFGRSAISLAAADPAGASVRQADELDDPLPYSVLGNRHFGSARVA